MWHAHCETSYASAHSLKKTNHIVTGLDALKTACGTQGR